VCVSGVHLHPEIKGTQELRWPDKQIERGGRGAAARGRERESLGESALVQGTNNALIHRPRTHGRIIEFTRPRSEGERETAREREREERVRGAGVSERVECYLYYPGKSV